MVDDDKLQSHGGVSIVRPRLDEKPWGGRRLERLGIELPGGVSIGEALVTSGDAEVVTGRGAGEPLANFVAVHSKEALGRTASAAVQNRPVFPLLVKLIDAHENLSIQVHPNDRQAEPHGRLGKTEAWHVLAAEPGAKLYVGLRSGVSIEAFREAVARLDGSSAYMLRALPAKVGSTILIPAGTVHALGAGVMVYEIQQPSDVTYRLDDWGRLDNEGNPREMHLDEGLAVMRSDMRPEWIDPVRVHWPEGRRHLLAMCRMFALERIALPGGGRYMLPDCDGPQVVSVLGGNAAVGDERLDTGRSAVIWPGGDRATLVTDGPTVALRGWVPEVARDLQAMTALSRDEATDLSRLSGPLPDVYHAIHQAYGVESDEVTSDPRTASTRQRFGF